MTHVSMKQMAEAKVEGITKRTIFGIDPYKVVIEEGWNGRIPGPDLDAHIERLYLAMKDGAQMPPIEIQVVDGEPVVREGHCRTLAARRIIDEGGEYVLDARHFRGNDIDAMFLMLDTGTGQLALSPLEQGLQYLKMLKMGIDVATIAQRRRIHRSTVENGIQLAEMPTAVHALVAAGKVAAHTALKAVKQHGAREAVAMLEEAAKGEKKVKPKQLPPGPGKKERGQTLPPAGDLTDLTPETLKAMLEAAARTEMAEAQLADLKAKMIAKAFTPNADLPPLKPAPFDPEIAKAVAKNWTGKSRKAHRHDHGAELTMDIMHRLAALNIIVSNLDRAAIVQLVKDARALVGEA